MKLSKSDGGHYDRGEDDTWAQFKTSLRFSSKTKPHDFVVDCFSKSNGLFKEMTLDEFAGVFGEKIHFGKVNLDDHGIEKRHPLYPEYDVLTPSLLRKNILVQIPADLTLRTPDDEEWPEISVIGGMATLDNDYTEPYCTLFVKNDDGTTPKTVTIPANTNLRFEGDISGGYMREDGLDSGFTTMGHLTGFKFPLLLYCNSNNPAKPFRYASMRKTTAPIIDWAYTN